MSFSASFCFIYPFDCIRSNNTEDMVKTVSSKAEPTAARTHKYTINVHLLTKYGVSVVYSSSIQGSFTVLACSPFLQVHPVVLPPKSPATERKVTIKYSGRFSVFYYVIFLYILYCFEWWYFHAILCHFVDRGGETANGKGVVLLSIYTL